eukprot:gnl/TRDRNA2_/TRDRNA2_190195_c0_seq1.p1 gnl/TRDRNA2_/TRDRNA2_190195_c0~~gnl/TRDRNA2_/TRDRNA2_190195_c0_seq1.p1  ORF type:complete len:244 (+),score=45.53 gnl/TRDRNA2_/TRDRNA2_190195_c0_seq1:73-804(+)
MPRFRLYKSIVAGATGRVGEALSRQLLLSPLCAEVHALGRAKTRAFDGLAAAEAKLKQSSLDLGSPMCGVDPAAVAGADVAFCVLGSRAGWADAQDVAAVERDGVVRFAELCVAAGVPHFSILSSAWAAEPSSSLAFAKTQSEAAAAISGMDSFKRVSIFYPGAVVDENGHTMPRDSAPAWASLAWKMMPVAVQFAPTRFRQIALDDLVLSMRLNVELCDASERVEMLDFKDMMQIIGREDDV